MEIIICHLYPDLMNLYGDRGNIFVLIKRAEWRDIDVKLIPVSIGDDVPEEVDIFFMGGGQDREQRLLAPDLVDKKGVSLISAAEKGVVFLGICGVISSLVIIISLRILPDWMDLVYSMSIQKLERRGL